MNEPRVFRHSPLQLVLVILVFGVLTVGMFATLLQGGLLLLIPFGIFFLIVLSISVFSVTSKAILSDTGITSQNLFGAKTLSWSEIHSVSGMGNAIKLHNLAGDITVTPSRNLPGYEEIVEEIGLKRPDLFSPQEHDEMTRNWLTRFIFPAIALLFMGAGVYLFIQQSEDGIIFLVFFFVIAAVFLLSAFMSPQSITIDGRSLQLKYAFSQRTVSADEIRSIAFLYYRTRNGKRYFIQLDLADGKRIKLSGINPSLPIVYLTLKNWHKQSGPNTSLGRF
jgi:uncharacterized membrane protein